MQEMQLMESAAVQANLLRWKATFFTACHDWMDEQKKSDGKITTTMTANNMKIILVCLSVQMSRAKQTQRTVHDSKL